MYYALVLLAKICYFLTSSESSQFPLKIEEYCISETFAPRCDQNQILVIESAIYGRKKFGRCLLDEEDPAEGNHDDPRFIGCYRDVKSLIMPKCFGKQECELRIAEIKTSTSCYKYLKLYLEVSYSCLTVAQPNGQCTMSVTQERQHLFDPQKSSCGSHNHPWMIETLPGQRIALSAITFISNRSSMSEPSSSCKTYGYILDKSSGNSKIPICLRLDQQETQIYKSKSNQVEVYFIDNSGDKGNFLVSMEATGCSDLIPPADAWLKRTENEATIGCYSTRLRWQLKCLGQRWVGVIGNCSYGHELIEYQGTEEKVAPKSKADQTVAIITIGMCGVVASFLIACIGIICIKKYHTISKTKSVHLKMGNSAYNNGTLPILANKVSNNDVKDNFQDGSQMNGTILPNDYHQQYYELDKAFISKDSVGQNDMEL